MSSFWRELLQLIGLRFMHPYFYKWSLMWCLDKLTLFFYTFLVCLLNWILMSWAQSQHLCQLVNFSSVAIIVELSFTQIWNVISAGILVFNLNAWFFDIWILEWNIGLILYFHYAFVLLCVYFFSLIFYALHTLCWWPEDCSRPDFARFAKQSWYVAPGYAHSSKYKEPKHQVLCPAG